MRESTTSEPPSRSEALATTARAPKRSDSAPAQGAESPMASSSGIPPAAYAARDQSKSATTCLSVALNT
jgi:hypothetical protein